MSAAAKAETTSMLAAMWRDSLLATFAAIDAHLAERTATDAIVHTTRRELKRLAALMRLSPSSLRTLARETRRAADETRRALGSSRNLAVMGKLIDKMTKKLGEDAAPVRAAVAQSTESPTTDATAQGRARLAELREAWKSAAPTDDAAILERVVNGYRRARRRAEAAGEGSAKALHSWRSAVVAHHYQMNFLARLAPELKPHAKEVDTLRDHLGDWNDIDMLQLHAHAGLDKANRRALSDAVADDKQKLEKTAARMGAKLFAARPRDFRATLVQALDAAQAAQPKAQVAAKGKKPKAAPASA